MKGGKISIINKQIYDMETSYGYKLKKIPFDVLPDCLNLALFMENCPCFLVSSKLLYKKTHFSLKRA